MSRHARLLSRIATMSRRSRRTHRGSAGARRGAAVVPGAAGAAAAPADPQDRGARTRTTWLVALAIAALTIVVYAPVARHDFVQLDDPAYVTENPHVRAGLTAAGLAWAFSTGHAANWHPLTWISHMADVSLFGLHAGAHHLVNLALHLASTLLLFFWLRRTTGHLEPSALVAALFALHPVHVESVAWIAERKDVLSTLFWMLTLWAYVRYVERPAIGRYALLFVTFALGLMAKPMLVTLPFVLLLLDLWPLQRQTVRGASGNAPGLKARPAYFKEKLPLVALAIASSVITFLVQQRGGAVTGLEALPLRLRVENALMSYAGYLGKMIWPADLAIVYGRPEHLAPALVFVTAAALIGATYLALRFARSRPYVAVGWFWYLGTLVPVIGLVQVGVQAMADRYTYVPLIGIFIAMAWGIRDLTTHRLAWRRAAMAAAVVVMLACAVTARRQVGVWKDNATLFAHATEVATGVDAVRAHHTVGAALLQQGRVEEALANFLEAKRLAPGDAETHYNLGLAYARQQRLAEATSALAEAIRLNPEHARAYAALGIATSQQGRMHEAIAHYRQAIRIDTGSADTHNNLGSALANQRRLEEATVSFREAVRLRADFHDARINLAVALAALGRRAEAVAELQEVLRRDPANARARAMLASIGGA